MVELPEKMRRGEAAHQYSGDVYLYKGVNLQFSLFSSAVMQHALTSEKLEREIIRSNTLVV
jgi:hypothetical protein